MQSLDLNLSSRPFRNNTVPWLAFALAALVLSGFTYWNVRTWMETRSALSSLRSEVETVQVRLDQLSLREQRAAQKIGKHDLKYLTVQADKANDVILRKALSWTRLFNLLERVLPYEVRMETIRPAFRVGESSSIEDNVPEGAVPVTVEGISKDYTSFLQFERDLLLDPHFDRVEPERNTVMDSGEIQFVLRFLYFPEPLADESPPRLRSFTPGEEEAATGAGEGEASDRSGGPAPAEGPSTGDPGIGTGVVEPAALDPAPVKEDIARGETAQAAALATVAAEEPVQPADTAVETAPAVAGQPVVPVRRPRREPDPSQPTEEELEALKHWKPRIVDESQVEPEGEAGGEGA